jgi:CysZ protein
MELVIRAAIDAVDDLRAPGIPRLFLICLGLTFLAATLAIGTGYWVFQTWLIPALPSESEVGSGFLFAFIHFLTYSVLTAALIVPVILLFWSLMIFIASFFDEYIAEKIEQHRYPALAIGKSHPFWQEFRQDIFFSLKIIGANLLLLAIPLFWPFWPLLFPLMNGYMLGRYFFRMAGARHRGKEAADALAKRHKGKITLAGLAMVIASGVPFLQLVVPFWGVAMMVHLYHLIAKDAEA